MKKTIIIEHELNGNEKLTLLDLKMMVRAADGLADSSKVEIQSPVFEQDGPYGGYTKGYVRITGQETDKVVE